MDTRSEYQGSQDSSIRTHHQAVTPVPPGPEQIDYHMTVHRPPGAAKCPAELDMAGEGRRECRQDRKRSGQRRAALERTLRIMKHCCCMPPTAWPGSRGGPGGSSLADMEDRADLVEGAARSSAGERRVPAEPAESAGRRWRGLRPARGPVRWPCAVPSVRVVFCGGGRRERWCFVVVVEPVAARAGDASDDGGWPRPLGAWPARSTWPAARRWRARLYEDSSLRRWPDSARRLARAGVDSGSGSCSSALGAERPAFPLFLPVPGQGW